MKASIFREFGGPEKLVYEDVPVPSIGRDEVLVRVRACALNHLDIWVRQGIPAYKLFLPHISGCDISGVVESVGDDVDITRIKQGGRVIIAPGLSCFKCSYCLSGMDNLCETFRIIGGQVDGGYAEYAKAPAINIIPIPDGISFEEAAAFPLTFLTSWHMLLERARLAPGEDVLIIGAGSGIGTAAVQIAKLAGARVIATAGSDEKLELAKKLGADEIINHSREDFSQRVKEITNGRGVDVVFEHVGHATWDKSMASLAKNGRLITCGATTGPEVKIDLRYVFMRQQTIMGSIMGTRRELLQITNLIGQGKLKPVIDSTYPLSDARKAQERMLNRENFGKIILLP
ncbi:MAG: zinc-binding dehydrogenase [Nitrospirae bacterium]|nr:zinc-binding dehydrogenase [Nitrospirota bacterium]